MSKEEKETIEEVEITEEDITFSINIDDNKPETHINKIKSFFKEYDKMVAKRIMMVIHRYVDKITLYYVKPNNRLIGVNLLLNKKMNCISSNDISYLQFLFSHMFLPYFKEFYIDFRFPPKNYSPPNLQYIVYNDWDTTKQLNIHFIIDKNYFPILEPESAPETDVGDKNE